MTKNLYIPCTCNQKEKGEEERSAFFSLLNGGKGGEKGDIPKKKDGKSHSYLIFFAGGKGEGKLVAIILPEGKKKRLCVFLEKFSQPAGKKGNPPCGGGREKRIGKKEGEKSHVVPDRSFV